LVKACFEILHLQTNVDNVVPLLKAVHGANFDDQSLQENLVKYVCLLVSKTLLTYTYDLFMCQIHLCLISIKSVSFL
jgi:hypothetical protein